MKEIKLKIVGMHCESCEKLIQMELGDTAGVLESEIDAKTGTGLIKTEDSIESDAVIEAVKKAGYKAEISKEK